MALGWLLLLAIPLALGAWIGILADSGISVFLGLAADAGLVVFYIWALNLEAADARRLAPVWFAPRCKPAVEKYRPLAAASGSSPPLLDPQFAAPPGGRRFRSRPRRRRVRGAAGQARRAVAPPQEIKSRSGNKEPVRT
ncbi:MAG: hypothetical protein ACREET_18900 [Stellaceae bacterium]